MPRINQPISYQHLLFASVNKLNKGIEASQVTHNYVYDCLTACKNYFFIIYGGHAVTQLVEALRYKPEGRGFDSRWCHWNFPLT
jgi:hypothetical protein